MTELNNGTVGEELTSEVVTTTEGVTQGQVNDELIGNLGNLVGLVTEGTVISK